MKKILFIGAEAMPFAATGGLGDVMGSVPTAISEADENMDIRVVLPLYGAVNETWRSKMKREVTIMFYYENKTSKEISEILNIPDSSVRWYLGESKKALKERIEMTEQSGIYKPIRLCVGHNGWTTDFSMCGLTTDVLMQNICYVCYHQPCTVEKIARTLGVAAVYLEDKINKLLYMDYLKIVGKNKYQTTFFITESISSLV